jgi:hypothetical protein
VNPFDPRENWQDLVSAFLLALGDEENATLVVKLVVPPELTARGLNEVLRHHRGLGLRHRCKLKLVTSHLSDAQLVELTRLSTYSISAARAEGACLQLQDFFAAGRPAIAPAHSAMTDYLDADVGFIVESHREPTWWAHDTSRNYTTSWQRIVWQSLHDRIRESYRVATGDPARYQTMAAAGRERMASFASAERVWPLLRAALDEAVASRRAADRGIARHEPADSSSNAEVASANAALR